MAPPSCRNLEITVFPSGVTEIAFNRPKVLNALSAETYQEWLDAILWAETAEEVKIVVLTGRGRFYSSGQELAAPDVSQEGATKATARRACVKRLVDALITFPKMIIAAVNGPAYGFAVTTLALCDVVFAASSSTFTTPFMKLGFCAEGCSSLLFPRIMGYARANEMLLMGKTFTVEEFANANMITRILPQDGFREAVLSIAEETAKFSAGALSVTKNLTRRFERDLLLRVNEEEMARLTERGASADSIESIKHFAREAEAKREAKKRKQQQQQQQSKL